MPMTSHHLTAAKNTGYFLPKILIIEDDLATADVMQEFFHMTGYRCVLERSTQDIIALVSQVKPTLILLDYLLPIINGGELCSQVKRDARFSRIPIIICSAYPKVYFSLGTYRSDGFLAKPFDLDDLRRTVERVLKPNVWRKKIGFSQQ